MISRRRKLLKSTIKKEQLDESKTDSNEDIEVMINDWEDKKQAMLKNFNVSYLEDMLNSSTKSVAREVVSTLVKQGEAGTL